MRSRSSPHVSENLIFGSHPGVTNLACYIELSIGAQVALNGAAHSDDQTALVGLVEIFTTGSPFFLSGSQDVNDHTGARTLLTTSLTGLDIAFCNAGEQKSSMGGFKHNGSGSIAYDDRGLSCPRSQLAVAVQPAALTHKTEHSAMPANGYACPCS
jgi:hypothetical protein